MVALHKPDSVFSLRHAPSWLMLCLSAGTVNTIAVLACERFVTHVTGTVTRLGMEFARLTIMLDFALVLATFVLGAMLAGLLINGRVHRGKTPWYSVPLCVTAAVTAAVGIAGHLGWLGPFGGAVDEPGDFIHLCSLSFAMGLQNAAVATGTGQLVRTTHLTGPATDLGVHLAELMVTEGAVRERAKQHAALRAGKIIAYALGAALAVPLAQTLGYLGFLVPACVIMMATVLSFLPRELNGAVPAPAE